MLTISFFFDKDGKSHFLILPPSMGRFQQPVPRTNTECDKELIQSTVNATSERGWQTELEPVTIFTTHPRCRHSSR